MMTESTIKALEAVGFKRWAKAGRDRMYVTPYALGLETSKYKTGNISSATWCGCHISNTQARQVIGGKYWIDVTDESIHATYDWYEITDKMTEMLEKAKGGEDE